MPNEVVRFVAKRYVFYYNFKCESTTINYFSFLTLQYTTAKGLYLHKVAKHPKVQPNATCDQCGKSFTTMKYLQQHIKTHNADHPCPLCEGQMFSCTSSLRSHIKSRHPELQLPPSGTPLKTYDWSKQIQFETKPTVFQ